VEENGDLFSYQNIVKKVLNNPLENIVQDIIFRWQDSELGAT